MDTNLTKNNKNNKFGKILVFLVRALFLAALLTSVILSFAAKQALLTTSEIGLKIFSGDLVYLPEFEEYMDKLTDNLLLGYVGSEEGTLTEEDIAKFRSRFQQQLSIGSRDIIYYIDAPDEDVHTNHIRIRENEAGELQLPSDYRIYYYWDGSNSKETLSSDDESLTSRTAYLVSDTTGQKYDSEKLAQTKFILGVRRYPHYLGSYLNNMYSKAQAYRMILIYYTISLSVTLILGLFCLVSRKYAKEARASYSVLTKKIWLEPKLLLLGFALWSFYAGYYWWLNLEIIDLIWSDFRWIQLPSGLLIYLLYADLRENKAAVFTNSIPVKLFHFIREYLRSEHWYRKIMRNCTVLLASSILCAGMGCYLLIYSVSILYPIARSFRPRPSLNVLGCLLVGISICLFAVYLHIRNFTKDTKAITDRLADLQPGTPREALKLSANSVLRETAENIDRLEDDIENMLKQRNRSNKLRVELITNVSHDLKTPLTSIINYADLLCEENLPEPAADYAVSLRNKSYRLKNMVQDVFELSKAASGNLRINKQPLDLAKLIRQTLADMDERIERSNLTFKTVIETEPIMIMADGEKLYRVFQNLFMNALQYSLENSRVYVMLYPEGGMAHTKIKNTSKEELNFKPGDIVERFVRADTSRTTEGSGLGLSIVQSFTEACGGTFSIDLDADMFTACVSFPLTEVTLPEDGASL